MISKNRVLIITGPTASGKTELSETLSQFLLKKNISSEILNADVGQFYKPLSVGTAKPVLNQVKYEHHLFDLIDDPKDLSVVSYRQLVSENVDKIWQKGNTAIIVGGSLFYIKSLFIPPLNLTSPANDVLNKTVDGACGADWGLLQKIDPERACKIHPNDKYRISRALQIWHTTGQKPSSYKPLFDPLFNATIIFICPPQKILIERVNQRTEFMIKDGGWIEEAKALVGTEWEDFVKTKGLIGYADIFNWLKTGGDSNKLNELIKTIQVKTIQYAKRQKTFWRSFKNELAQYSNNSNFDIKILEVESSNQVLCENDEFNTVFCENKSGC